MSGRCGRLKPFSKLDLEKKKLQSRANDVNEIQLKTTDSTQEAFKTHLNVGAQAVGVMNEKSSHVAKTEKKVDNLRVSKRKRISL